MTVLGVIFDCDGTLLDSMEAWTAAQDELTHQVGIELSDEETTYVGTLTIFETGEFFHRRFGIGTSGRNVVDMIDDLMEENYRTKTVPRTGALEFVKALSERGIPCAVASSTPQKLLQIGLTETGFAPFLTAIVSVDDVGASKREPLVYNRARDLLGTSTECTWVFEDAAYALNTAIAAGYRTVGIYDNDLSGTIEQLSGADISIREFTDLDVDVFISAH